MTTSPLVVHGTALSGHTHRVINLLGLLGLPHRLVDSPAAVRRTPEFLALNPLGQIPVLQDGDVVLADSNAILVCLARRHAAGSPWLPDEPIAAARVQRWLSIVSLSSDLILDAGAKINASAPVAPAARLPVMAVPAA
jgi:glutathione S-transferase